MMKAMYHAALDRKVRAIPGLLLAGILLTLVALASSCGGGVAQEEFDAEKARVADLRAKVDKAEAQMALVQSQLAQARAEAADLRKVVDGAEALQTLLTALLAWNRKDSAAFQSSFTERGLADTVMSLPESIGNPPIGLRRIMDAEVSDDVATIHVMFGLGTQRNSLRHSLVKTDDGWKIDAEERLSPKIKEGTPVADIRIDACSLESGESGSTGLASGKAALRLENAGNVARHLALVHVRGAIDLSKVEGGQIPAADVIGIVAHVHDLGPGESANLAFTAPLSSGRYALVCVGPADADRGVVADLVVP